MTHKHFDDFLAEAVQKEPGHQKGLSLDELYGLYTSWCLLNGHDPEKPEALWTALWSRNIDPGQNDLAMKGPAAVDYIVASAPNLV